MKITFLGQAGLLFEKDGFRIMIDPYLSDSASKINAKNYRRIAADEKFFDINPDVMIFTHNHLDHYDPETVKHFITEQSNIMRKFLLIYQMTFMPYSCPSMVWETI